MIGAIDIAWAAGFIEGEGTFAACGDGGVSLTVPQVQREPLERLQELFGGNVRGPIETKHQPIYKWGVHGQPAAAATMTVFTLLSPRRKTQALTLIDKWKAQPGHRNSQKTHCPQGHEYTLANIYWIGPLKEWRACKVCHKKAVAARTRALRLKLKQAKGN